MIVALTGVSDNAERFHLANSLAALRALAGRNVLLAHHRLHAVTEDVNGDWEAVDIKIGAASHVIGDAGFQSALEELRLRYDDVVVDIADTDPVGCQLVLNEAEAVIIFIQSAAIDLESGRSLQRRIRTAVGVNPALRIMVVISRTQSEFFARDLGSIEDFFGGVKKPARTNTSVFYSIGQQRVAMRYREINEYASGQESVGTEVRNLYRAIFQIGNRPTVPVHDVDNASAL